MRRITLYSMLALTAALTVPQVAGAQTTQGLNAHFSNVIQKQAPPCPEGALAFCGTGTVAGFGAARYGLVPTGVGPLSGGCQPVTAIATVTLADGSGAFTAAVTASVCFPGNSHNAPGGSHSFGNPLGATGTFVITGGTGAFAGATGSGTATLTAAGAHSALSVTGTITV